MGIEIPCSLNSFLQTQKLIALAIMPRSIIYFIIFPGIKNPEINMHGNQFICLNQPPDKYRDGREPGEVKINQDWSLIAGTHIIYFHSKLSLMTFESFF
jgi:hypothetical protein